MNKGEAYIGILATASCMWVGAICVCTVDGEFQVKRSDMSGRGEVGPDWFYMRVLSWRR